MYDSALVSRKRLCTIRYAIRNGYDKFYFVRIYEVNYKNCENVSRLACRYDATAAVGHLTEVIHVHALVASPQ